MPQGVGSSVGLVLMKALVVHDLHRKKCFSSSSGSGFEGPPHLCKTGQFCKEYGHRLRPSRLISEHRKGNPTMSYQPIENYGIVGNMRTVALVGMNGSIDWYCYPHFDSPSIFGAILDDKNGGVSEFLPTLTACGTSSSIGLPRTSWLRASC